MDQVSWEKWLSELEMETQDFLKAKNSDQYEQEHFLRDILQNPSTLSFENEETTVAPIEADGGATAANMAYGTNVVHSQQAASETTPPTTCLLSFDKSAAIPVIPGPSYSYLHSTNDVNTSSKPKRTFENLNVEPRVNRGTKKVRSGAGALDHIMSERRRRQELTERFIALSATIPGLKKIDKASILSEAISYVKQLQERVRELEEEMMKKSQVNADHNMDGGTPSSEMTSDDGSTPDDVLPDVKARISENKQVLIRILCQKQKCAMLKILDQLKNLHLMVFGNSVMTFGSSALDITVIAQMTEEYSLTTKDVVKCLKIALS